MMEPLDIVLLEQDRLVGEFEKLLNQALHPPDPMTVRDPSWGRSALNVQILPDEIDLNILGVLLPKLREIKGAFMTARRREIEIMNAVRDALPDASLNLENRPMV